MPLEVLTYENNVLCFTMCFLRELENIWEKSWRFVKTETKISALNEVKRLCIEHYSLSEILEARDVLFELYNNFDFLNKPTKHESGSGKSDLMQDLLCLLSRVMDCELPMFVTDSKRIRTPRSVQTWVLEQSRSDRPVTYIQAMARNSLASIEQGQEPPATQGVQQLLVSVSSQTETELVSVSSQTETETETLSPISSPRPVMKNKSTEMRKIRGCVASTQTTLKTRDHYTQMPSLDGLMTSETKTTPRDGEVTSPSRTTSKDSGVVSLTQFTSPSGEVTSNTKMTSNDNGEPSQGSKTSKDNEVTSKHSEVKSQSQTASKDHEVTKNASLQPISISCNEIVSNDDEVTSREMTSRHYELSSQCGSSDNASQDGKIAFKLRQYDRETLFGLRDHPLSRVSPVFHEDWKSYVTGSSGQGMAIIKQSPPDINSADSLSKTPVCVPAHVCTPSYVKKCEGPGWGDLMTPTEWMSFTTDWVHGRQPTMTSETITTRPSRQKSDVTPQRETSQDIDTLTTSPTTESAPKISKVTLRNKTTSTDSKVTSRNQTRSTDSKVTTQNQTTSTDGKVTSKNQTRSTDSKVTSQCRTTSRVGDMMCSAGLRQYSRLELLGLRYGSASLARPELTENWNQYFQLIHLPLIKRKGIPGRDLPAETHRPVYAPADGYVTVKDVTSGEPPLGPSLTKDEFRVTVTGVCSGPHPNVDEHWPATQYDRKQLLCLQNHPAARSKPNFPQDWNAFFRFPLVMEKSLSEERQLVKHFSPTTRFAPAARTLSTAPDSVSALTPAFVRSASSPHQHIPVPQTVLEALATNMPDRGGSLSRRTLPVIEPPILHKAERPWMGYMVALKRELADNTDPDLQEQKLFMEVRSILNKLTPQNFNRLLDQMKALEINTERRLCGVINRIYEKAISEPKYSVPYALFCKCLSAISVPSGTTAGRNVTFRVKVLARCQHEFEKDRYDEEEMQRLQTEIDEAKTELEKRLQELGLEEYRRECKRRSTGNMRFIGELFKLKMLTAKIMHQCLVKLIDAGGEEDLECFCVLLTTTGKELDVEEDKEKIDEFFKRLQHVVDSKRTSMRIRCLILDLMDLRANNWERRRPTEEPTTIDHIRREAQAQAASPEPQNPRPESPPQNTRPKSPPQNTRPKSPPQNTRPKSPPVQAQSASPEPQHSRSGTPNSESGSWTQVSKPNSKSKKKKKKNK